jgi:hypothetical protein
MAKKPEPPKPIIWNVYKIASKAVWLAAVEVLDEAAAIERGAAEFKVPATKLIGRYMNRPRTGRASWAIALCVPLPMPIALRAIGPRIAETA